MFENILSQDRAVESLVHDIHQGALPRALLFTGPAWAGKLSAALELARTLACTSPGAPWNCVCPRCASHKSLLSPYLMLAGRRNFAQEIRGAGIGLLTDDREAARILFVRTVRKLSKRFDPVIWEGEAKLAKAAPLVEKLEDALEAVAPGGAWSRSEGCKLGKKALDANEYLGAIYEYCDELAALLPHDGISAAMIRRLTYWSHTADSAEPKFIILEGVQGLNETARNSLLKTLEEPPPEVWFILLAPQRQGIMPTILSRVRSYQFCDRGPADQDVLARVFRQERGRHASLQTFFAAADAERQGQIEALAGDLWTLLAWVSGLETGKNRDLTLASLLSRVSPVKDALDEVCKAVLARARAVFRDLDRREVGGPPVASAAVFQLVQLLSAESRDALAYNRSLGGFIEAVYTKARAQRCAVSSSER